MVVVNVRYKCLILDHDDTAVDSTGRIHYPSFVAALKELRPNLPVLSLDEFMRDCFDPGFAELCTKILQFTPQEQQRQQEIWQQYNQQHLAPFFPGFPEFIKHYRREGGIVTVVSHSDSAMINRSYLAGCGFVPDAVYGWELGPTKIKPNPYPVQEILKRFNLQPSEALAVDDSRLGLEMAAKCHVPFAAAGWSPKTPNIQDWMSHHSAHYFAKVNQLAAFVD